MADRYYDLLESLRSRVNWTERDIITLMAEIGYGESDEIVQLILQSVKTNLGNYISEQLASLQEENRKTG